MASPPLASPDDLAARLGIETDELDTARAEAWLADASTLVRDEAGQSFLTAEGDLIALVPDIVTMITLAAAQRAYENPSNVTQKSTADTSMSFAARGDSPVYLTEDECKRLRRLSGAAARGGLFAIQTTRGPEPCDTGYVPTDTPGVWFPWYSSFDIPAEA